MKLSASFKTNRKVIVNLYGTPGSGKSTLAFLIMGELKRRGVQAHFVEEKIKLRAFDKTPLAKSEQIFYQREQERALEAATDADGPEVIVTDSPLLLSCYYSVLTKVEDDPTFADISVSPTLTFHKNINLWVNPWKEFSSEGRFHTEEEAEGMASRMKELIKSAVEGLNDDALFFFPLEDVDIRPEMFHYDVQRLCDKIQGFVNDDDGN